MGWGGRAVQAQEGTGHPWGRRLLESEAGADPLPSSLLRRVPAARPVGHMAWRPSTGPEGWVLPVAARGGATLSEGLSFTGGSPLSPPPGPRPPRGEGHRNHVQGGHRRRLHSAENSIGQRWRKHDPAPKRECSDDLLKVTSVNHCGPFSWDGWTDGCKAEPQPHVAALDPQPAM